MLVVCASCSRHTRSTEARCPFCAAAYTGNETVEPTVHRAKSRAGIVGGVVVGAVAMSTALFGSACGAYGAPPPYDMYVPHDAGVDDG
jgi:hypothetical protein